MVLKKGDEVVAASQARIVRLPVLGIGIAYMRWGPMWRLKGKPLDGEVFRQAVRALRNEFSLRRRLVLRLYPLAYRDSGEEVNRVLREEGYQPHDAEKTDRTLIIDLTSSLQELNRLYSRRYGLGGLITRLTMMCRLCTC